MGKKAEKVLSRTLKEVKRNYTFCGIVVLESEEALSQELLLIKHKSLAFLCVKMEKFNVFTKHLVLAIYLHYAVVLTNAQELSNSTADALPVINKSFITLDLTKCSCSSPQAPCDLTIIKSNVIDLNCLDGENLCCPTVETPNEFTPERNLTTDPIENNDTTITEPPPKGNIRVYSINPTYQPYSLDATQKADLQKQKRNCQCKARSSCPHKYIDYGFGFHCSYSTVRCCIPDSSEVNLNMSIPTNTDPSDDSTFSLDVNVSNQEDKSEVSQAPQVESNVVDVSVDSVNMINESEPLSEQSDSEPDLSERSEGELTITEVTNSWSSGDYQKEPECFCLPVHKCQSSLKLDTNNIERRRDTLCPGDLTQCCGMDVMEEITKKQDDTELERTNIKLEYPPYQQPVQLPNSKLPMEDEDEHQNGPIPVTSIIPPPSLPTQYHSYEPSNHQAVNNYRPNTYPSQLSGPQEYRNNAYGQNIRPWVGLSSPSASYAKYPSGQNDHPGYPRGPYPDNGSARSSKPSSGGFLDTLAQMLG